MNTTTTLEEVPFASPDRHIYFNGFALGVGAGDVVITLLRQKEKVCTLNLSYTVAKTLANALKEAIEKLEVSTGNTIMTVHEVNDKLSKSA